MPSNNTHDELNAFLLEHPNALDSFMNTIPNNDAQLYRDADVRDTDVLSLLHSANTHLVPPLLPPPPLPPPSLQRNVRQLQSAITKKSKNKFKKDRRGLGRKLYKIMNITGRTGRIGRTGRTGRTTRRNRKHRR